MSKYKKKAEQRATLKGNPLSAAKNEINMKKYIIGIPTGNYLFYLGPDKLHYENIAQAKEFDRISEVKAFHKLYPGRNRIVYKKEPGKIGWCLTRMCTLSQPKIIHSLMAQPTK
jgi:hypothetical protein